MLNATDRNIARKRDAFLNEPGEEAAKKTRSDLHFDIARQMAAGMLSNTGYNTICLLELVALAHNIADALLAERAAREAE